jgi:uncharacterized protein (UPF0276 family)
MLFAINYSFQAAALLKEGRLQIDRFKTPDWPWMIAEAQQLRPAAVHFNLKAGDGKLSAIDWGTVERLVDETGTPFVNLHLDPKITDFPGFPADTPETAQFDRVVEVMLADVRAAVARFGAARVIAENVPYRGSSGKALRPAVEPAVIQKILAETGCGLLLDISHARIAAHHLGIDERGYMAQLPVERLRELHFTGLHNLDGRLQDHLEVLDTDWPVLEWALARIRAGEWAMPWLLAFEYGGVGEKFAWRSNPEVIAAQVPRLYEIVKQI